MPRKRKQLMVILDGLSDLDYCILVLRLRIKILLQAIKHTTPRRIFFPFAFVQLAIFIIVAYAEASMYYFIGGSVAVVAIAIFPSTLSTPPPKRSRSLD